MLETTYYYSVNLVLVLAYAYIVLFRLLFVSKRLVEAVFSLKKLKVSFQ